MDAQSEKEKAAIAWRRQTYGIAKDAPLFGLALSGGGIRSATFSLGVLQGLAERGLLQKIDYLSSVSGGGYVGAFFRSLFIPESLRDPKLHPVAPQLQASWAIEKVLRSSPNEIRIDPPGQENGGDQINNPIWLLREHSRYLAPNGTGDYPFALAYLIRNWFGMQLVFLSAIFAIEIISNLAAVAFFHSINGFYFAAGIASVTTLPALVLSPAVLIIGLVLLLLVTPLGVAYWLSEVGKSQQPRLISGSVVVALLLSLSGLAMGYGISVTGRVGDAQWYRYVGLLIAWLAAGGLVAYYMTALGIPAKSRNVPELRHRLTSGLAFALLCMLAAFYIALIDSLALSLYKYFASGPVGEKAGGFWQALWLLIVPMATWLVRQVPVWLSKAGAHGKATLLERLVPWLLPLLGLALFTFLAVICATLVHSVIWQASLPWSEPPSTQILGMAGMIAFIAVILVAGIGVSPGFLNLSSINAFYTARLIRAYLGASNPNRLRSARVTGTEVPHEKNGAPSVRINQYADNIAPQTYHDDRILAPVHLINITLNQTVSPNSQLLQQDRKGRNCAVCPDGIIVDDTQLSSLTALAETSDSDLQIGQWVAISGAAVSSGMGQATSLGTALLCTFANIRLGYWWPAPGKRISPRMNRLMRGLHKIFETHFYLLAEMTARYDPIRQKRLYLSDGGHFENTAVYELLRRQLPFILLSDGACDPDYTFGDLANLVRKARIDFGIEMTFLDDNNLEEIFPNCLDWISQPAIFNAGSMAKPAACAVACRLNYPGGKTGYLLSLKPRLTVFASMDVSNYAVNNRNFPQETTADQFFDEAQWESYRKLGYDIAKTLFAKPSGGGHW